MTIGKPLISVTLAWKEKKKNPCRYVNNRLFMPWHPSYSKTGIFSVFMNINTFQMQINQLRQWKLRTNCSTRHFPALHSYLPHNNMVTLNRFLNRPNIIKQLSFLIDQLNSSSHSTSLHSCLSSPRMHYLPLPQHTLHHYNMWLLVHFPGQS